MPSDHPTNVAFYYPGQLWADSDWVKNLLLFFDGIALLVPEYKAHEPFIVEPELSEPLLDAGDLQLSFRGRRHPVTSHSVASVGPKRADR